MVLIPEMMVDIDHSPVMILCIIQKTLNFKFKNIDYKKSYKYELIDVTKNFDITKFGFQIWKVDK